MARFFKALFRDKSMDGRATNVMDARDPSFLGDSQPDFFAIDMGHLT